MHMHIGIRESGARQPIARALADAGLKEGGGLTLFGGTRLLMPPRTPSYSAQKMPLFLMEAAWR